VDGATNNQQLISNNYETVNSQLSTVNSPELAAYKAAYNREAPVITARDLDAATTQTVIKKANADRARYESRVQAGTANKTPWRAGLNPLVYDSQIAETGNAGQGAAAAVSDPQMRKFLNDLGTALNTEVRIVSKFYDSQGNEVKNATGTLTTNERGQKMIAIKLTATQVTGYQGTVNNGELNAVASNQLLVASGREYEDGGTNNQQLISNNYETVNSQLSTDNSQVNSFIMTTVLHEAVHEIKQANPEGYNSLVQIIRGKYASDEAYIQAVLGETKRYSGLNAEFELGTENFASFEEEFVAEYTAQAITNDKLNELVTPETKTFFARLIEVLQAIFSKFRGVNNTAWNETAKLLDAFETAIEKINSYQLTVNSYEDRTGERPAGGRGETTDTRLPDGQGQGQASRTGNGTQVNSVIRQVQGLVDEFSAEERAGDDRASVLQQRFSPDIKEAIRKRAENYAERFDKDPAVGLLRNRYFDWGVKTDPALGEALDYIDAQAKAIPIDDIVHFKDRTITLKTPADEYKLSVWVAYTPDNTAAIYDVKSLRRIGNNVESNVGNAGSNVESNAGDVGNNTGNHIGSEKFRLVGERADGIEVYETSDAVRALPWAQRKQQFKNLMAEEYRGRTAKFNANGNVYYAAFDADGISKMIYGNTKSDRKGRDALVNTGADGAVFELVENAQYSGSKEESGKKTAAHKNVSGWDYFVKTVQIDNSVFDLVANVRKKASGEYVYSLQLNDNKKVEAAPAIEQAYVRSSELATRSSRQDTASNDDSIAQSGEDVNPPNEKFRLDEPSSSRLVITEESGGGGEPYYVS
jgi:hypothetical protein